MNKSKISPTELISYIFLSKAFTVARHQHPELTDELDLLPYVCEILKEANDRYEVAMKMGETGKDETDAMHEIYKMFRIIEGIQDES